MIKKLIPIIAVLCGGLFADEATPPTVKVDRRVELMSIVGRLADWPGYTEPAGDDPYVQAVDRHFEPSRNHPLIQYARAFAPSQFIGYDKIPALAVVLDQPGPDMGVNTERLNDNVWTDEITKRFVPLLGQFYQEAKCGEFFESQSTLYAQDEEFVGKLVSRFDTQWFRDFFGHKETQTFTVIPTRLIGNMQYGAFPQPQDGKRDYYVVVNVAGAHYLEKNPEDLPRLFGFGFVYEAMSPYSNELEKPSLRLLAMTTTQVGQGINENWRSLIGKNLVSAIAIRYMMAHHADEQSCREAMQRRVRVGYLLVPRLVKLLESYESQRDTYPAFERFMPEIVRLLQQVTEGNAGVLQAPRVVRIDEFKNGSQDVDPGLARITIRFDQPMMQDRYSIYTMPEGNAFKLPMKSAGFTDSKTFAIELKTLAPDHEYKFIIKGENANFKSSAGIPLEDCEVNFKTKS